MSSFQGLKNPISDLSLWSRRFGAAAASTLEVGLEGRVEGGAANTPERFVDEAGHRRQWDRPFLAWRQGIAAGAVPDGAATETRLWYALHDTKIDVDGLIAPLATRVPIATPILQRPAAIEVATETELCAMHALWWLGVLRGRPDYLERCIESARWMIEHIQPDNATNHPWGIHVFVLGSGVLGDEAVAYAGMMLHNCQVSLGRPDLVSAHALADAARAIDERLRAG